MDKCKRPKCPCSALLRRQAARQAQLEKKPCDCEYGCGYCKDRNERAYIEMHHVFIDAEVPYWEKQPGVFILKAQGGKEFFFWPTSGKWRQKGKETVYRSRGPKHVLSILTP